MADKPDLTLPVTAADLVARVNEVENESSDSGTSGPGGETIQVGGTQPASGWWLDNGQPLPDGTAPSTPTGLTATATGDSTVNLSWNASTDNIGVTGYNYRIGTGAAVNAGAGTTETVSGLSGSTTYSFQVQAYDAQGNVSSWSASASATTLAGPDLTDPTPGTLAASDETQSGFTLTVTGASDDVALAATPYAFSTDNGATWSAWQSSTTYAATGLSASTGYQARHKVRDAAGNEATGTAITVTTTAPAALLVDTFDRADTTGGGTLGTATSGQTWIDPASKYRILGGKAVTVDSAGGLAHIDVGQHNVEASFDLGWTPTGNGFAGIIAGATITTGGYRLMIQHPANGVDPQTIELVAYSATGQLLTGLLNLKNTTFPTGTRFSLKVVEDGTKARVTLKQGATVLHDADFTHASRDKAGTLVAMYVFGIAGANTIDNLTVTPA